MAILAARLSSQCLRYTPRGGRIEVAFSDESGRVQIRVGNTGKPIPVEHREAIF